MNNIQRIKKPIITASLLAALSLGASQTASAITFTAFQGLGDLAGGGFFSRAFGVSDDGSIIVGSGATVNGFEAFRYVIGGGLGMEALGDLTGGAIKSDARAVSNTGVIVGTSTSANGVEAFRYTDGGGMVGLGDLSGGTFSSQASGISSDGNIIVGSGTSANGVEAFRYTSGGMVGLDDLPGGDFFSQATGISSDGNVIVGLSQSGGLTAEKEAFRYTISGGMVGLGDLDGGSIRSIAGAVSADGSVVVGVSTSDSNVNEAFRYTISGGMVGLGDLAGGSFSSQATGVSGDGSIIIGESESGFGQDAFIWDETSNAMQSIREGLIAAGFDLSAWSDLRTAQAISADGSIIVGYGRKTNGSTEAFYVGIETSAVPVPAAVWLMGSALAGLFGFGRKKKLM